MHIILPCSHSRNNIIEPRNQAIRGVFFAHAYTELNVPYGFGDIHMTCKCSVLSVYIRNELVFVPDVMVFVGEIHTKIA